MFLLVLLLIYFVSFTDKPQTAEPALSPRALEQREKWDISIDESDYPVSEVYLDSLRALEVKIHHTSRWFNGATVEMNEAKASEIAELGFVSAVEMTRDNTHLAGSPRKSMLSRQSTTLQTQAEKRYTDAQLATFNLHPLHEAGYHGQGILIAVCDGGFKNANSLACFRQEQELGHFDFTDDTDDFYGSTGTHGTQCLSAISGIKDGFFGAATESEYYLMRSEEYLTESPKEMDNLVAALEKADSLGVNVFSVSLGYGEFFDNSTWNMDKTTDLDGKKYRASRAASIAARKGMLVCVAAGNEGADSWRTLGVPGDADSILTVGAVDTLGVIGSFSSYGPTTDGRVKPEICAVGVQTTLINPGGIIVRSNGTSFATPLLAGMAASLWSALPDENAMQIRERIIRSADHYTSPDPENHYGYGIPDAWVAYTMNMPEDVTSIEEEKSNESGVRKFIRGDQILIFRHGHVYNLAGQRVR